MTRRHRQDRSWSLWPALALFLGSAALGWLAGNLAEAPRPASPAPVVAAHRPGPMRLRIQGRMMEQQEIRRFGPEERAAIGATKLVEVLQSELAKRPELGSHGFELPEYLAGWGALVRETRPYDPAIFQGALAKQLCSRPAESALLAARAPSFEAKIPGDCPR
jgi:hypothetical protein